MSKAFKFAVIGGGSWATAIVKMLCQNVPQVGWYMRNESAIAHLKNVHHNPNYLSSVEFNIDQLYLSNQMDDIVSQADCIVFAIPSAFLATELKKLTVDLSKKVIFSAIKGIDWSLVSE